MIFIGFTSKGCFLETSCAARRRMNVLNLCLQREICDSELHNMSRLHINSICTRLFPLSNFLWATDQESIKQSQLSVDSLTSADSDDDSLRLAWQRKCRIFCVDNHSSSDVLLYAFSPHQLTQSVYVSTLTYFMSKHLVQGHFAGFCVRCSQQVCCLKPLTLKSQPAFITYINIFHLVYFSMFALQVPPRADLVFVLLFLSTQKD